jgi:tetrahydromethanopterin S-methyltransferase subunit G
VHAVTFTAMAQTWRQKLGFVLGILIGLGIAVLMFVWLWPILMR